MKASLSDNCLYPESKLNIDRNENDTISCGGLNTEQNSGLHYLSSNIIPPSHHHRRLSKKTSSNTIINQNDSNGNGLIINGFLFDGQLFQPSRSSYIIDAKDTPKDVNQYLEGHDKGGCLDPHLYKLSFIITLTDWCVDKELLLDYYPREYDNKPIMEEITFYKRFCFPELNSKQKNGGSLVDDPSTYVFTRTYSNGHVEYGYCRRIIYDSKSITKYPVVICIVSTYRYFKLYDAILNELTKAYISNESECRLLMQSFYSKPLPIPTVDCSGIVCKLNTRRIFFYVCPYDDRLNHDYYSTLLSCLSPNYIVHLFESMLRSKKILCYSQSLSKLTKCCLALSFLIYPFMWTYSFVSVMPSSWLHDLIDSPCPYIYGYLTETMHELPSTIDKDSLRVNLDGNTIDIGINDGFILPLDLRQTLQASLEYLARFRLTKSNLTLINLGVSEACLHVFTELFHRLPDYFKRDQILVKSINNEQQCSNDLKRNDSGIDVQSVVSNDIKHKFKHEVNRLGYDFRSDEFLISQPTSSYVTFLNDFIRGMIFLKFLDDYQRIDNNSKPTFLLFSQRLNERRRMTIDQLSINPVIRFRQTFDLLEKEIKNSSQSTTKPTFSKFVKKFFE